MRYCWCCRSGQPITWFIDPVVAKHRTFCDTHEVELAAAMLKAESMSHHDKLIARWNR